MTAQTNTEKQMAYSTEEQHMELRSPAFSSIEPAKNELRTVDGGLDASELLTEDTMDPQAARRVVRKIDFRVIPLLRLLYLYDSPPPYRGVPSLQANRLAFIDRSNLGNAKIAGVYEDL